MQRIALDRRPLRLKELGIAVVLGKSGRLPRIFGSGERISYQAPDFVYHTIASQRRCAITAKRVHQVGHGLFLLLAFEVA